ncbi:MAG: hypothetical protein MUF64_14420 [Polyangiaceae bacterium]|nr:hypothetical protein [Polyangiaceae bacterium]
MEEQRGALREGRIVRVDVVRDGFGSGDVRMSAVDPEATWLPLHFLHDQGCSSDYLVFARPVPPGDIPSLADPTWEHWGDMPGLPPLPAPPERPRSPGPLLRELAFLLPVYGEAAAALEGARRLDLTTHLRLIADALASAVEEDAPLACLALRALARLCPSAGEGAPELRDDLLRALAIATHARAIEPTGVQVLMPPVLLDPWLRAVHPLFVQPPGEPW